MLRALLLQAFYTIRSERQLVERIEFDLLFRWFVGLGMDDPVWDAPVINSRYAARLVADANRTTLSHSERSNYPEHPGETPINPSVWKR